jgi:hypothetical protein
VQFVPDPQKLIDPIKTFRPRERLIDRERIKYFAEARYPDATDGTMATLGLDGVGCAGAPADTAAPAFLDDALRLIAATGIIDVQHIAGAGEA